jgi:NAD(P)-dependent dehydrogenase (short-subunit alcohol dehydrogenase family)
VPDEQQKIEVMFNLEGKVILVTGGSRGIGAAIVRDVVGAGADVVIQYNANEEKAEALADEVGRDKCLLVRADFEHDDEVLNLWKQAVAWKGRVDVLVNSAGIQVWAGVEDDFETWNAGWHKALQIDLFATAHLCREAIRHYLADGGGIIVTISSQVAHQGVVAPNTMHYAASKAGEKALMQSIARCYSSKNILAYTIAPGIVRTDRALKFAERIGGEEKVVAELAMGEMIPPEDVAAVAAFLATGKARHTTGATIDITGGNYIR